MFDLAFPAINSQQESVAWPRQFACLVQPHGTLVWKHAEMKLSVSLDAFHLPLQARPRPGWPIANSLVLGTNILVLYALGLPPLGALSGPISTLIAVTTTSFLVLHALVLHLDTVALVVVALRGVQEALLAPFLAFAGVADAFLARNTFCQGSWARLQLPGECSLICEIQGWVCEREHFFGKGGGGGGAAHLSFCTAIIVKTVLVLVILEAEGAVLLAVVIPLLALIL